MSRGFLAALGGLGMTLLAWYGPWAWPAWPAFTALDLAFGKGGFTDLPYAEKGAVVVALIAINVAFWGLAIRGGIWIGERGWRACRRS